MTAEPTPTDVVSASGPPWILRRTGGLYTGARIGPYEVMSYLGGGGMGEVWQVRHVDLDCTYALKVIHRTGPAALQRFLNEGRHQSRLVHPNIVRIQGMDGHQGSPYLVMELVEGGTLESFLQRGSRLRESEIDLLARGIIRGVRALHRFHLVHRDLKPSNILLQQYDDELTPKISDFGLVKLLTEEGITRTNCPVGTPRYMAPEQYSHPHLVDERADLFALGCILYELVTRRHTFPGDDIRDVRVRIERGEYVPVTIYRPDCQERMRIAIEGCLRTDPSQRIPDCDTLEEIWSDARVQVFVPDFRTPAPAPTVDPDATLLRPDPTRRAPVSSRGFRWWPLALALLLFGALVFASAGLFAVLLLGAPAVDPPHLPPVSRIERPRSKAALLEVEAPGRSAQLRVLVDGVPAGLAPGEIALSPGMHRITVLDGDSVLYDQLRAFAAGSPVPIRLGT